jgi:RES domain-containing protein
MGETVWYRIVGRKRMRRDDVLPARSGRFHEDPVNQPTSYLGDSLRTVWKEGQAARAGSARVNPDAFAGWRVVIRDARLVDFREAKARKKWDVSEGDLLGDPAPPKCKEAAGALRRSREGIHGILYRSVRHPPDGVCLALFLEKGDVVVRFERVSDKEWKGFVDRLGQEKE